VFALDKNDGNIKWERAAIGSIEDIYLVRDDNLALVIDSVETHKTRIAEYNFTN